MFCAMINKKLLICGAIATALFVTACVKKEAPKEEEQQAEVASETTAPAQFEQLDSTDDVTIPSEPETTVEEQVVITNTAPTEIRREVTPAPAVEAAKPAPRPEPAKVETAPEAVAPRTETAKVDAPKAATPAKPASNAAQSQEDAVAAAIAAATPALDK